METIGQLTSRFLAEAKVDAKDIVKELINTSFGGSNEDQMKAVQLLKGLALSDDPAANKFMKDLDKATSAMKAIEEGLKAGMGPWNAMSKSGKVLGTCQAVGQKNAHRIMWDSLDKKAKAAWDKDGNIVEKE
jgi:hypothetical protein